MMRENDMDSAVAACAAAAGKADEETSSALPAAKSQIKTAVFLPLRGSLEEEHDDHINAAERY